MDENFFWNRSMLLWRKSGKCPAGPEDAGGHQQRGRPTPAGRTFRPRPQEALEAALDIAAGMGLDAHTAKGTSATPTCPAQAPRRSPPLRIWTWCPRATAGQAPPFDMVRRDGYVVGRGVADDKGPAVLTLYAAKVLQAAGRHAALYAAHPAGRQPRRPA